MRKKYYHAVVPGYYLVCYNSGSRKITGSPAVVPGYYLVCYNIACAYICLCGAVVPGYYLVCYNAFPMILILS